MTGGRKPNKPSSPTNLSPLALHLKRRCQVQGTFYTTINPLQPLLHPLFPSPALTSCSALHKKMLHSGPPSDPLNAAKPQSAPFNPF